MLDAQISSKITNNLAPLWSLKILPQPANPSSPFWVSSELHFNQLKKGRWQSTCLMKGAHLGWQEMEKDLRIIRSFTKVEFHQQLYVTMYFFCYQNIDVEYLIYLLMINLSIKNLCNHVFLVRFFFLIIFFFTNKDSSSRLCLRELNLEV